MVAARLEMRGCEYHARLIRHSLVPAEDMQKRLVEVLGCNPYGEKVEKKYDETRNERCSSFNTCANLDLDNG